MYDSHIDSSRFYNYRGMLSNIYQGEDTDCSLEEIEEKIDKDYNDGKLSSNQYGNLQSLIQDINGF